MRPTEITPDLYDSQLAEKAKYITEKFAQFNPPKLDVFSSPTLNYRMRAEFRVWHEGDDLYHIMFDQQTQQKYRVDYFPPACELINQVMSVIILKLKGNNVLRRKLFQIDYLASLSNEIVVSLLYHTQLDKQWEDAITLVLDELRQDFNIHIIGRAKKQKHVFENDFVIEKLNVKNREYYFKQTENSFTQPNALVNQKMIGWALEVTENIDGDLLELYCGLGNFTLPLATQFPNVVATEISKSSVAAAKYNMQLNNIHNVAFARMSSEELSTCLNSGVLNKRLTEINFDQFDCKTVLVDPPRAGLDEDTLSLVQKFEHIVYISCNPDTLFENLTRLCLTHNIERFALFDQFPYTHHAECGIVLSRK